jgi:PBSX family phage terminase large subunit
LLKTLTNEKELKLLKHQYELVADTTTSILGLVSGYGGGKTFAACHKAITLMIANAGHDGIITEPNYPLLVQILIPELKKALEFFEIPYRLSVSDTIFYCSVGGIETRIICKSMESVDRIIGINAAWVVMDEFDTAKQDLAYGAYLKLLARIRVGNVKQMVIVSTPEGFKAMYRIFVTEGNRGNKRLIKARTSDNKYLDKSYLETLTAIYPSNLLSAYLDGEFLNLTAGTVYPSFDRKLNATDETIQGDEPLHIGLDFNVTNMSAIIHVLRGDKPRAVMEYTKVFDTPAMIGLLKAKHPNNKIFIYPDASGQSRKSNNASQTDITLLQAARFQVMVNHANPAVKDRILIFNKLLEARDYLVNPDTCPELVESLEKQAYDKNGEPDKSSGLDHVLDAAGYMCAYRYQIRKPMTRMQIVGI